MRDNNKTIYEQPLNEHSRVCLRIEHLLHQADHFANDTNMLSSMAFVATVFDLLNVLDRPDLRNRLIKELNRYHTNLARLEQTPHVDRERLINIMGEIENMLDNLRSNNGKFAQHLRDNEFFNTIRPYKSTPGGICVFDTPRYYHWLQRPFNERSLQQQQWLTAFDDIRTITQLFLGLTRESSVPSQRTASQGFFQTALDPHAPNQLIRVELPKQDPIYPQISVGRHGISIRFMLTKTDGRIEQLLTNIEFELTCCTF